MQRNIFSLMWKKAFTVPRYHRQFTETTLSFPIILSCIRTTAYSPVFGTVLHIPPLNVFLWLFAATPHSASHAADVGIDQAIHGNGCLGGTDYERIGASLHDIGTA